MLGIRWYLKELERRERAFAEERIEHRRELRDLADMHEAERQRWEAERHDLLERLMAAAEKPFARLTPPAPAKEPERSPIHERPEHAMDHLGMFVDPDSVLQ